MNGFKKIIEKLGGEDKLLHVESSCMLFLAFSLLIPICKLPLGSVVWLGVFSFVVGILKEVYDATHGERFDLHDLLADFVGVVIGVVIILILL